MVMGTEQLLRKCAFQGRNLSKLDFNMLMTEIKVSH